MCTYTCSQVGFLLNIKASQNSNWNQVVINMFLSQIWLLLALTLSNPTLSDSDTFQFWHFLILTLSDSDTFQFWHFPILTLSNSDTFRFWNFPILTLSDSDTFQFLPKWAKLGFWHFPILTLSNPPRIGVSVVLQYIYVRTANRGLLKTDTVAFTTKRTTWVVGQRKDTSSSWARNVFLILNAKIHY